MRADDSEPVDAERGRPTCRRCGHPWSEHSAKGFACPVFERTHFHPRSRYEADLEERLS